MIDPRAQAAVNLHAVLRSLEDLCELDEQSSRLVADAHVRLTFRVPGMAPLSLTFTAGRCVAAVDPGPLPAGHDEMALAFAGARHLNAMVDGKGVPIPLRGVRRISFLTGPFTALTTRLESLLRPAPGAVLTDAERHTAAVLTAYIAFFAVAAVANHDALGQANAHRIPDGALLVDIADGPAVTLDVRGGVITPHKGRFDRPRARLRFDSLDTAAAVLDASLDSYAAMGSERLAVSGFIPMLDNLNKILVIVARYLA